MCLAYTTRCKGSGLAYTVGLCAVPMHVALRSVLLPLLQHVLRTVMSWSACAVVPVYFEVLIKKYILTSESPRRVLKHAVCGGGAYHLAGICAVLARKRGSDASGVKYCVRLLLTMHVYFSSGYDAKSGAPQAPLHGCQRWPAVCCSWVKNGLCSPLCE